MESLWIPEDDSCLRKSIEKGASLESLAKGAKKFSRKLTFSELTNRWHSLLYNPQVTSLSSSTGYDLQYSDQLLHHQTTSGRSQYYAARKRMRLDQYCHNVMSLSRLELHPEVKNGFISCTLNQESNEIPDNDDINFKRKPPLPPIRGSSLFQTKGNDINHKYASTMEASCPSSLKDNIAEKAVSTLLQQSLANEIYDVNTSMPEEEEENNNEIESDEDMLSFSDVEAMVLDMDLEPVGQDRYELEVSRYRNEEMARRIMRLEQSSYTNRNIESHEDFDMLYGRSKHYINKQEVLLGRVTGEYPVDIDLGRSESGKKVQTTGD